jgi:hypothetical protein
MSVEYKEGKVVKQILIDQYGWIYNNAGDKGNALVLSKHYNKLPKTEEEVEDIEWWVDELSFDGKLVASYNLKCIAIVKWC